MSSSKDKLPHHQQCAASYYYSCHLSHLPQWLQNNDYLHHGHRPPLYSYKKCLQSVFSIHTETGNIWSHLIGFKIFIWLAVSFWSLEEIYSVQEKWVFSSFFAGAIICMTFSILFHTFYCHSEQVGEFVVRLDYCGICILITSAFIPWNYYCFYCETTARNLYYVLSLATCTICLLTSFSKTINEAAHSWFRIFVFGSCGFVYLIPATHFLLLNGLTSSIGQSAFSWLGRLILVAVVKCVIYACRIPERWIPGKCDIWFQSHQIFHVLTLVSTMIVYLGVREVSAIRLTQMDDDICLTGI